MPSRKCYLIGNTHIDHTWVWNWTEGFDEVYASFQAALDRMEEYPEFVFTCSSTLLYRWVEENDPVLFARIKQRIAEGRWQIAGGWVVQSDNNIPCGEAYVRQGLYGQGYFQSRFGQRAKVGYCVDSFGHHAQLPQILRLQGMEGWLHFRPSPHEMELPVGPYCWRGIDGSEVIACRPPGWYCTPDEKWFENTSKLILEQCAEGYPEALFFYGVGDHGGGPTIRDLNWIRKFREEQPEVEFIYGSLDVFYQSALERKESLPTVKGDLQYSFRGCYTTNGQLKSLNRRAEGRLLSAETTAALTAMWKDAPTPKSEIDRAWDHLLTNHFHDIICGTCAPGPTDETLWRYGGILETADRIRHPAVKRITAAFDRLPPAPYPESLAVCLVNSLAWERHEPVEFFPNMPGRSIKSPTLVDGEGNPVDFQLVEPPFGTAGPKAILFTPAVPAGGAAIFHVVEAPERKTEESDLRADAEGLENAWWRVGLNESGQVVSLFHKRFERELLREGSALELRVMKDLGDSWGTERKRFGEQIGAFTTTAARVLETGPLRAKVEVRGAYLKSTSRLVISLYRDFGRVEFDLEVLWNDQFKTVKVAFPLPIENAKTLYEIPFGALERPANGEEQPVQKWLRVEGESGDQSSSFGFVVDTIGGADVATVEGGTDVNLTLLRSPYYGYLTAEDSVEGLERPFNDQGVRRAVVCLTAGDGSEDLGLPERGEERSQPLQVVFEGTRPGERKTPFSLLRCEPNTIHVAALKAAEDGDGSVVRLVETRGLSTTATVTGPDGFPPIQTSLRPFEIQSWRWKKDTAPVCVNLLEETMAS